MFLSERPFLLIPNVYYLPVYSYWYSKYYVGSIIEYCLINQYLDRQMLQPTENDIINIIKTLRNIEVPDIDSIRTELIKKGANACRLSYMN